MGPETLALVSLGATAASAGVSAFGAIQQGEAAKASADYNAAVQRNNAIIQGQNAARAAAAGRSDAQIRSFQTAAQTGAARAAYGAAGTDLSTGTPSEVQKSISQMGQFETMNIMDRALNQARSYNVAAMSDEAQARLLQMQGQQAQAAGITGALGSIVGGAASVGAKFAGFQNQGIDPFSGFSGVGSAWSDPNTYWTFAQNRGG